MTGRGATIAAAVLVLSGCVSLGGGKAPPSLFSLTPTQSAPAGTAASGRIAEAIVVEDPLADQRLSVLRVAVQVDPANVAYLKDAQWVERPARLFGALLGETLRARGNRLVMSVREAGAGGATRLSGRLLDMGYDAQRQAVIVRFDAIRNRGGEISTRRFENVVPGIAPKPEAVAPALNQAANAVAAQVADWVG